MFGIFSNVLARFWGSADTEEPKNGQNIATGELSNDFNSINGQEVSPERTLRKCCNGRVTKLYDDSGIIDEDVFFNFDTVIGGTRPKVHAEVHYEASRGNATQGWRATRVELLVPEWGCAPEDVTQEILIGEITEISDNTVVVNDGTLFDHKCLAFGYSPAPGDWVRLQVMKERGIICKVKSAVPLREKTFTGCITAVSHGHGYVDRDIFFTFGACQGNYIPRKGHNVTVTAIESNQGKCKWRAIKIHPKPVDRATNHRSLFPDNHRNAPSKFTQELCRDKSGITVSGDTHFGNVVAGTNIPSDKIITIRNCGESDCILQCIEGVDKNTAFFIRPICDNSATEDKCSQLPGNQLDIVIKPEKSLQLSISVNTRFLGAITHLVVFNFGSFQIGRHLSVNVRDGQEQYLNPSSTYRKRQFVDKSNALADVVQMGNDQHWVIPGERPVFKRKTINISTRLKQYEIPRSLRQYIIEHVDLCCLVPSLGQPLSLKNYRERFSALLHAEEVQMELEMREFDLKNISLRASGDFLSLAVPGLAEGRPSLLIGDKVMLTVSGRYSSGPRYEGFIHEVLNDAILLKFHEEFHVTYDMDTYDVVFFFNRTPLRRAHRALEMAHHLGEKVLFPTGVTASMPQVTNQSKQGYFNKMLNERQRAAVNRILSGQCRPMPYILFGPPGTGKTVTMVEAMLQVFHRIGSSRILACTPSNSAADLIAERLHQSGAVVEGDMVRLNAFQRQQNIPEDIENYSISIEQLDVAAHYRVVVCTCTTAGQLHQLALSPGHFTHVFIDEAGQATEPESLVPISLLAGTDGQTVLAGDPHQLGAVLRSSIAQTYGLAVSLLERLMALGPYLRNTAAFSDHGSYDPLTVTKLVNNYRSHRALLSLPSQLFYHNELRACATEALQNCLCTWDALINKDGFPILFHGCKGQDLREGNSPSWFNAVEAVQVIRYVQGLRSFKEKTVDFKDIGIITPYRKQVEKIRLLLDRLGLSEVKVGSVEEFQGQERLVVIISTVRSSPVHLDFDYVHNLGFLSNPKRFNVAITRAQALMVIIGNPHVLSQDWNWRALLRYCVANNAYVGCDLPPIDDTADSNHRESVVNNRDDAGTVSHECEENHASLAREPVAVRQACGTSEETPDYTELGIRGTTVDIESTTGDSKASMTSPRSGGLLAVAGTVNGATDHLENFGDQERCCGDLSDAPCRAKRQGSDVFNRKNMNVSKRECEETEAREDSKTNRIVDKHSNEAYSVLNKDENKNSGMTAVCETYSWIKYVTNIQNGEVSIDGTQNDRNLRVVHGNGNASLTNDSRELGGRESRSSSENKDVVGVTNLLNTNCQISQGEERMISKGDLRYVSSPRGPNELMNANNVPKITGENRSFAKTPCNNEEETIVGDNRERSPLTKQVYHDSKHQLTTVERTGLSQDDGQGDLYNTLPNVQDRKDNEKVLKDQEGSSSLCDSRYNFSTNVSNVDQNVEQGSSSEDEDLEDIVYIPGST